LGTIANEPVPPPTRVGCASLQMPQTAKRGSLGKLILLGQPVCGLIFPGSFETNSIWPQSHGDLVWSGSHALAIAVTYEAFRGCRLAKVEQDAYAADELWRHRLSVGNRSVLCRMISRPEPSVGTFAFGTVQSDGALHYGGAKQEELSWTRGQLCASWMR